MILQDYNYWFIEIDAFLPSNTNCFDRRRFGKGGGGGSKKMPVAQASTMAAKAPTADMSQAEQQNKRLAASALTKDWNGAVLGNKALLGG